MNAKDENAAKEGMKENAEEENVVDMIAKDENAAKEGMKENAEEENMVENEKEESAEEGTK